METFSYNKDRHALQTCLDMAITVPVSDQVFRTRYIFIPHTGFPLVDPHPSNATNTTALFEVLVQARSCAQGFQSLDVKSQLR